MIPHLSRLHAMSGLHQEKLDQFLREAHYVTPESIVAGRNITAGYTRAWGLQFGNLVSSIQQDPIYRESIALVRGRSLLSDVCLMNLFLIMKYGMQEFGGDIIEFGTGSGGSALFMGNVARRLEWKGTIYTLDTFEGMPEVDALLDFHSTGDFKNASWQELLGLINNAGLTNVVPIKGRFEETVPSLLCKTQPIVLAHIDCDIYSSVKYAITSLQSSMHPTGSYLVFDDPLKPACIGALQAVEELLQDKNLRAEQAYPHLVYRMPQLLRVNPS